MGKCSHCGADEFLPFSCPYCGKDFCSDHRLPENHDCANIHLAKAPRLEAELREAARSSRATRRSGDESFVEEGVELKHILIAWLALSLAFSARFLFSLAVLPTMFFASLLTVGLGFVLHELAHKFVAQRFGYWAEFRMWPWGLALALFFALASGGRFIFAAPGATYIVPRTFYYGWGVEKRESAIISLAGPLTNLALAFAFLPVVGSPGILGTIGNMGFQVNVWLAAFNLIPFGGMDGQKILSWSAPVWALTTVPIWAFMAFFIWA